MLVDRMAEELGIRRELVGAEAGPSSQGVQKPRPRPSDSDVAASRCTSPCGKPKFAMNDPTRRTLATAVATET